MALRIKNVLYFVKKRFSCISENGTFWSSLKKPYILQNGILKPEA